MTIYVLGYYHHQNAGDDAFALYFRNVLPDHTVELVDHSSRLPFVKPKRLIFGGGAVLNDYFLSRLPPCGTVDIVGCSFPYGDSDVEKLVALKDRLGIVALRSRRDTDVALQHGIDARHFPDLCFALQPGRSWTVESVRAIGDLPTVSGIAKKTLVLLLSDDYTERSGNGTRLVALDTYKRELAAALDLVSGDYNIVMLPMSCWYSARDAAFAHDVASRMRHAYRVTMVNSYLGPEGIMDIINSIATVVVSMKFHGLVFGMIAGRPVINIGDTRKNIDLMNEVGLSSLSISDMELTRDRFIDALIRADESRQVVVEQVALLREQLEGLTAILRQAYLKP
jgi:polysaccharide pyruvyl transferase WcaK-like protein